MKLHLNGLEINCITGTKVPHSSCLELPSRDGDGARRIYHSWIADSPMSCPRVSGLATCRQESGAYSTVSMTGDVGGSRDTNG